MRVMDESILCSKKNARELSVYRIESVGMPLFHGILGYQLMVAKVEARQTEKRYSHQDVFNSIRQTLQSVAGKQYV